MTAQTTKKAVGRPSSYTPEKAEYIIKELVKGRSLRSILKDKDQPSVMSVFRWISDFPEFREQYTCAREIQAEKFAEEILEISDKEINDVLPDGKPNHAAVQRHRLMVDSRKWLASKLFPKRYGDRVATEISGDAENPLQVVVNISGKKIA